ncbi:UDP-N-acetylmuramate dehydrogenase [Thermodesulfobacteriota bacterium]
MNAEQRERLVLLLGGNVQFDCPMSNYTTLKVGGSAEALCEIKTRDVLKQVISFLSEENLSYEVLGWGSNVIIKDTGIEGAIIVLKENFGGIDRPDKNGTLLLAGAGCGLGKFVNYCKKEELGGIEFLAGIPGTIGGAVTMNAGAFGKEISTRIVSIELINSKAKKEVLQRDQINFSYRSCKIKKGNIIVGCCIGLDKVPREEFLKTVSCYLRKRKAKQPIEYPSAGSIFKNPPGDYAGRIIESVGLKGKKIGKAMISEKHANFIINTGGATASDVIALINLAREAVKEKTQVVLETEVKIIGR